MFTSLKKFYDKNPKFYHILALVLIVLLGGFLRFYNLDQVPPALNQDEAINGYDAYAIANTGRDEHGATQPQPMLQSFGDWTSPLITFITVPFVKFLGLNVWTVRLPVALLGTASILLLYLLVLQLFKSKNYALIAAFILALSPWAVSISRWAIPPSIVPFFLLVFLNLFFWALNSGKFSWDSALKFIIAGLSAGILAYSYPTMKLFVPIFVGVMCLIYLRTKFRQLFVMGLTTLVTIAPIFYLTIMDPGKYNARYATTALSSTGENFIVGFIMRYFEYLTPTFSFGYGDANPMHKVPGFSSIPDFLALFFYLGLFVVIYKIIKSKGQETYLLEKHKIWVLLAGIFTFPIAAALTKEHFMLLRSIHGFIFITLFVLIGIRFLMQHLDSRKVKNLIIATGAFLILINAVAFSAFYFTSYAHQQKRNFNYGMKEAFEYVQDQKQYYDNVYIDRDILQIYYLFYSQYDANKLHDKSEDVKFNVFDNGKIVFKSISSRELRNAYAVKTIEDKDIYWIGIYAKNNDLYVVKFYRYKSPIVW